MPRTPRPSKPDVDEARRDEIPHEPTVLIEHERLQDAAGRDAEAGRNSGRESDETRQST